MRTFIYKRTHQGDPDNQGWFGNEDCMGSLRCCVFDAVIGVGGICGWAEVEGISQKVNWIGIGAKKRHIFKRGPLITFEHFVLFEERGVDLKDIAPGLAKRLLSPKAARFLFSDGFDESEREEVRQILELAETAPPSARYYKPDKRKNDRHRSKVCGCKARPAWRVDCHRKPCGSQPSYGQSPGRRAAQKKRS